MMVVVIITMLAVDGEGSVMWIKSTMRRKSVNMEEKERKGIAMVFATAWFRTCTWLFSLYYIHTSVETFLVEILNLSFKNKVLFATRLARSTPCMKNCQKQTTTQGNAMLLLLNGNIKNSRIVKAMLPWVYS